MRGEKSRGIKNIILMLLILGLVLVFLLPVILTVAGSFVEPDRNNFTFNGYYQLFLNCFPFYRYFWNSVIYTFAITAGTLIISIPAAFAFKFARFKGKNLLFVVYIINMMMPFQVMVLPNYIGLRDLGIINTPWAIILPMIFSPFAVVVTHQYMREIDSSVIEAARLESNSAFRILLHSVVPQIKVCIAAVGLFVFADAWNMVEQPLLYVNDDKLRNLSAFIANAENFDPGVMLPASVIFMIPVFLCYMLFHEELKEGLKALE